VAARKPDLDLPVVEFRAFVNTLRASKPRGRPRSDQGPESILNYSANVVPFPEREDVSRLQDFVLDHAGKYFLVRLYELPLEYQLGPQAVSGAQEMGDTISEFEALVALMKQDAPA